MIKRIERITEFKVKNNAKLSLEKELKIAEDYFFSGKSRNELAEYHNVPKHQIWNVSNRYKLVFEPDKKKKARLIINDEDLEFVHFLLSEHQITHKLPSITKESKINE